MKNPNLESLLQQAIARAVELCFGSAVDAASVAISHTPKEYRGQFTAVVFPFVRLSRKSPEETGRLLGEQLLGEQFRAELPFLSGFNTVKGFLNLELSDSWWLDVLASALSNPDYGCGVATGQVIVLEYCGPNTNKPLHLGHVRNMLLGWSTAELLAAAGHEVHKVNIYNDRGIAICKSMAAYLRVGQEQTPASTGIKGDHFVGSFYVAFNRIASEECQPWLDQGMERREAEKQTPIYAQAHDLLLRWEADDAEVRALWSRMNGWVYEGFNKTYQALGVDFERDYLESDTYLLGKTLVEEGVKIGVFKRYEDGSVRADLTAEGLDEKLLLRSDGSSMYITQDLGTAELRFADFHMDRSVYVVGSEQDYHFKVLEVLLRRLGRRYAAGIFHLSYGMVDLPSGKMKSREGTTVDADDLVAQMVQQAREKTLALGKIQDFDAEEAEALFRTLGLGALKYFILKVDPRKRILFNPEESIELQGNTGPFIQYTYARIQSMLRKADAAAPENEGWADSRVASAEAKGQQDVASWQAPLPPLARPLEDPELAVLALIQRYPAVIQEAAAHYSPAEVANFAYELAKTFNQFYDKLSVLHAPDASDRHLRLAISAVTAATLRNALRILGIAVPERM
ncbi:MAG: arginine--tRNA ligase [Bacteroidetes bacterium]|nr:arginine--tRNA ligase [Bacteroidota bacterium]